MTERQLQFRVGLFALAACAAIVGLILQFGDLKKYLKPSYPIAVHFDSAAGVYPSTPVRKDGLRIGEVDRIIFDEKQGGVLVVLRIDEQHRLRVDAKVRFAKSLLGDTSIDIESGDSPKLLPPGSRVDGIEPEDPFAVVQRMEKRIQTTLGAFERTNAEWQLVGHNLNQLMDTNEGNLNLVVERTATSLAEFTKTMQSANEALVNANKVLGDPEYHEHLKQSLAGLPKLVQETRDTIAQVRIAVTGVTENMKNLQEVTDPLAEHSKSIVVRLDNTAGNLESMTGELNTFAQLLAKKDGTAQRMISDPQLYENLSRSSASLAVLLKNLEPVIADLRVFSDKVARHPELIGVSGALSGSSGLKDPEETEGPIKRTGGILPFRR